MSTAVTRFDTGSPGGFRDRASREKGLRYVAVAAPALFLAAVTFVVFFTAIVVSHRTFWVFPDNSQQFYAWYQKLASSVHHGGLPIWDANVYAGHSFVGELQPGAFYPVNLVWVWLFGSSHGIAIRWLELIVAVHFWLAALGMYFAARTLGMGRLGGLAAALCYAFVGAVASRSVGQTAIFYGLCYLPWAFAWFQRWWIGGRRANLVGCAVSLALIILAGHGDAWLLSCLLIGLSIAAGCLRRPRPEWPRRLAGGVLALVTAAVGSLVLALPQVALSAQYFQHAVRFVGDAQPIGWGGVVSFLTFTDTYSFHLQDSLSLIDPVQFPGTDGNVLYVGLIGLAIALMAAFPMRARLRAHPVWRKQGQFVLLACGVTAVLAVGYWTFVPAVLRLVPFGTEVRELARYVVILQFFLALLVGLGVEVIDARLRELPSGGTRLRSLSRWGAVATGGLALNALYLHFAATRDGHVDHELIYQSIILAFFPLAIFVRKKARWLLLAGIVASAVAAPVWFMPKVTTVEASYPPNYYRQTAAITYLEQFYGKARVEVLNDALPPNIGDVYPIQTVGGHGASLDKTYFEYVNQPDPPSDPGEHMALLNTRFVVDNQPHPGLQRVLTDPVRGISVYELPDSVPRAYFADQVMACIHHANDCAPVEITHYSDTEIALLYRSATPETLVLSETVDPGWRAYLDGRQVSIHGWGLTNLKLFRSVAVPAGQHRVVFRYQPFGL